MTLTSVKLLRAVRTECHWHRISYHLTYGLWTHRT